MDLWKNSELRSSLLSFLGMAAPKSQEDFVAAVNERAARYMSPQYALHLPAGAYSSCVSVTLPTTARETAPVNIELLEPAYVVGVFFEITGPAYDSFFTIAAPTLNDILVRAELPRSKVHLNQRTTSPASTLAEGFAPMASLDARSRLLCLPIQDPNEKIRFTYRSVYPTAESAAAGSGFPVALTLTATAIWVPQ
jgi:hypothetical protein